MEKRFHDRDELCVLTNSMGSGIRWRLEDYKAMLQTELAMLAAATEAPALSNGAHHRSGSKRPAAH